MNIALRTALAAVLLAAWCGSASANVDILIDKTTQHMTVEVDGAPYANWPVSTGKAGHSTPSGTFRPFRMEKDHFSKEWDDAPMPYSIFFTQKGHAIHGTLESRRLGVAASHGCVRLSKTNAAALFAIVAAQGMNRVKVQIVGDESLSSEPVAGRGQYPVRRQFDNPDDWVVERSLSAPPSYSRPRYYAPTPYGAPAYVPPGYFMR